MMLKKLREINERLLEVNPFDRKQQIIKNLLQNNECFFKMNINVAYSILGDLKISDDKKKDVYLELIKK